MKAHLQIWLRLHSQNLDLAAGCAAGLEVVFAAGAAGAAVGSEPQATSIIETTMSIMAISPDIRIPTLLDNSALF